MFRLALGFLAIVSFSFGQNLPALRWVQQVDNLGKDIFSGMGTDAQGNVYVVGNTISPTFPVKAAVQNNLGSAGVYRIDGPGSAYTRLGVGSVISYIAGDPKNPSVFYAVSSGSGVKSVDGGNTWTPLSIPSSQVVQFAVDPANDQNVYAVAFDNGFFKSTDGGSTWSPINSGLAACRNCGPASYLGARSIWIDPNSSALFIYYGASAARSGDGGASWQTIGPSSNDFAVYFETPKPGVVYLFPYNYGPLKSTDDGLTFQGVNIPVNSIFADPNQPGRLLGNGAGGVFESDDDGVTWTLQLKFAGTIVAADWANRVLYASNSPAGIAQISSDLKTVTQVGPPNISVFGLTVSNGHVYVPNSGGRNVFVTKFDPSGNVIYSTYFGGSGDDPATAMTVDAAGSVYVAGNVNSVNGPNTLPDFPTTKGVYSTSPGSIFLFKLNPDGSVGYSTYFPAGKSTAGGIALDASGAVYLTGTTNGGLPTTPGAYQTVCGCQDVSALFFTVFEPDAFLTKFDASASTLVYSTYLGVANAAGKIVAIGPDGSAYLASNGIFGGNAVYHFNSTGSSLLGSMQVINIGAMAVGGDGSVYIGGNPPQGKQFQATAGAFQTTGPLPALPYQGTDVAAIMKVDAKLQNVLAATYFGGPYGPSIEAMAIDAAGNIYVGGGSPPLGVPTRTPLFEAFAIGLNTGFLSEFSGDLSTLLFSTYLGDNETFSVMGVALGSGGSVVIGGATSTLGQGGAFQTGNVYLNSLTPAAPPALRVDAIVNAASMLDGPLSGGETIVVRGAGFGNDAQLMIAGAVVPALSMNPTQITAVVPSGLAAAVAVHVQSGGAVSNQVLVPVTAASPGLFSADGSGSGQGYILNQDGTLNTPANPAAPGDRITIYITGVGPVSFTDGYAVTASAGSVFVDGFYCNGVAAVMGPVAGFPGNVYQMTVYIPTIASLVGNNPDLKNFVFPSLDSLVFRIAGGSSQTGVAISIGQ
jgi:uncharacterized protein (TIGR03437 family)